MQISLITTDLILKPKITGLLRQYTVILVNHLTDAPSNTILLLDLHHPEATEAALTTLRAKHAGPLIGFYAHKDTGTARNAKRADFDHLITRSALPTLPTIMKQYE